MDDEMKSILHKNKTEEKKINNDKIKQLEIDLFKILYADNPDKVKKALKEYN